MRRCRVTIVVLAFMAVAASAQTTTPENTLQTPEAALKAAKKAEVNAANQQARAAQQALNAPMVARFAGMSPQERDVAMSQLPQARRAQLEQKLENYAKIPAEQRQRIESQYNRLQAMTPERQAVVRQALAEYLSTASARKATLANEMTRLSQMNDQQRTNYMTKSSFIGRFSAAEIQMMSDLRGVVP